MAHGKRPNLESGNLRITGVSPKMKLNILILAKEDCMDMGAFVRSLLKRELDRRENDLEKIKKLNMA